MKILCEEGYLNIKISLYSQQLIKKKIVSRSQFWKVKLDVLCLISKQR